MPETTVQIQIDILSFWRSGTGSGLAAQLDNSCIRDSDDCPYLPGRHIKGLFRDAVRRMGKWDENFAAAETTLFGDWGFKKSNIEDGDPIPFRGAQPGLLGFTDARMAESERHAFANDNEARKFLFRVMRSTALDEGVAKTTSLRSEEVAIPVSLFGEIEYLGGAAADESGTNSDKWLKSLQDVAPLIRAVGGGRMRGLGRAKITVGEPS